MKKTFQTIIVCEGSMCFIPVPFDPKPLFGKVRAPVKVTLNGYTFRSTVASMALKAAPPAWERWHELSYTHQREHVEAIEAAKKPETRARRIAATVEATAARAAKRKPRD